VKSLSAEIIEQLQYVKVNSHDVDMRYFPDFMVIGPQRTGTTWLYENLKLHPQVFMTEVKEPLFFNKLDKTWHPRYVSSDLDWYLKLFEESPRQKWRKTKYAIKKYREVYWPKVRGEASASYAAQKPEIIREIALLNPDIKAILIMRNPIDRAWSHAKKDLGYDMGRELSEIPDVELERFFHDDYILRCGHFSKIIETWQAFLKEGHLFTATFDELKASPDQLLERICAFLEIRSGAKYSSDLAHQVIGLRTEHVEIPSKYRDLLAGIFREEIRTLTERYHVDWAV
jgi:hypothetical protein